MIETLIAKYYAQISCLQITDGGFISHIRVRDLPFEICKLLKNHRMLVNLRWLDIFLFTLVNVRVIVSHPVIKSNFSLGSGEKESISARSNSLYQSLKFSLISNVPFRDLCRWEPVNFIRVSSKASDSQVKATMNGIIIWKPREYGRRTLQFPSVWAFSFPVAVSTKSLFLLRFYLQRGATTITIGRNHSMTCDLVDGPLTSMSFVGHGTKRLDLRPTDTLTLLKDKQGP